ncbi:olfactory receptor 6Y1-like [Pelobates fuscus]|uniref:olfactory receptor 6Y1-like n=1 Tax=Pelobates fuscus TaxID=191477 RepID=UPI002FE49B4E
MSLQNQTVVREFIMMTFNNTNTGRFVFFFVLLLVFLITLIGNLLIIVAVYFDARLHTPMYFFLSNFSFSEIVVTTNITPCMLHTALHGVVVMSVSGCITQYYIYWVSTCTECLLLAVMSYDRYLAICNPLHYSSVMSHRLCLHLVVWCWLTGIILQIIEIVPLSKLSFCGPNIIDFFFCDLAPILQLSCSSTSFIETSDFILSFPLLVTPIVFIILSYIKIISSILKISSTIGRKKAFSTCSSHLMVLCTYYGILIFIYTSPSTENAFTLKKVLSLLYTVLTPLINPFIYSLRNKDIKLSIRKTFSMLK